MSELMKENNGIAVISTKLL